MPNMETSQDLLTIKVYYEKAAQMSTTRPQPWDAQVVERRFASIAMGE